MNLNIKKYLPPVLLLSCTLSTAHAWEFTQHIKYNLVDFELPQDSPLLVSQPSSQQLHDINYRLNLSEQLGDFQIESHYQLNAIYHPDQTPFAIDTDQYKLFDLSSVISDKPDQLIYHRLDRFSVSYSTTTTSTRFGRQAVTWGNGLVFNVMDIFNPFSPTAIDKEYKTGDDMLYIQTLTDSGNEWQFIYLPRRNSDGDIKQAESSVAAKLYTMLSTFDINLLVAEHYNDFVLGLGLSHAIRESLWRLDITHTDSASDNITSLSTNIDFSWTSFNKNMYGFIEYYINGFGIDDSNQTPDIALLSRIERGELFSLYRHYLSAGLRIELHPLLNLSPTLIHNLDDSSSLLSLSVQYDWLQNLSLTAQLITGTGNKDSEYNGANSPGDSLSVLLSYYF